MGRPEEEGGWPAVRQAQRSARRAVSEEQQSERLSHMDRRRSSKVRRTSSNRNEGAARARTFAVHRPTAKRHHPLRMQAGERRQADVYAIQGTESEAEALGAADASGAAGCDRCVALREGNLP